MLRLFVIATLSVLFTGCGLIPRTGSPSQALMIADAMGIPAEDMPKAKYNELRSREGNASDSRNIDNSVAGAAQLIATGDPTLLLLSGFTPGSTAANVQVAAWVPADIASSPDESVAISSKAFIRARAETYATNEEARQRALRTQVGYVLGQPYGDGGPIHAFSQLLDMIADHSPNLVTAPAFMKSKEKAYGPIFLGARGRPANREELELTLEMSKHLPSWFFIYSPGLAGVSPPVIMNEGRELLFVAP
ncbi:hypothetical protein [Pseudomonas sp. BN411]|uniref:hypothetical protein n=1 Tax=Pseudomonas sp. BN411 TaxID=2567887 RepID=UPI0024587663|nr:hypothetical protein [Pseudomonas sp. BN411]MDH4562842.1 hypothetical protein [Pseudomonas sp. BN411]